jgi:DNA-binding HxlR family transcriptional regulator
LIVRDLAAGPRRFVELQRLLPGISTEQLRSRLNRMVADGMLTRRRFREVPPRVEYELTERARELMPVIGELAHWGYEWTWTRPRPQEQVDIDAIFRLAPGLLRLPRDVRGELELTVEGGHEGEAITFVLTAASGGVSIEETIATDARARVSGTTDAWVRALSPAGDRSALRISGDRDFAGRLLDGIAPPSAQAAASRAPGINAA